MSLPVMHPAKRRKLDESSSTLSKPFRSPMRVDVEAQSRQINHNEQIVSDRPVKVTDHKNRSDANVTKVKQNTPHPSTEKSRPPLNSSSPVRKSPPPLSASPHGPAKDAEYTSFQKQHSALTLQLSKLRQAIDTAQQALKIQSSNADTDLDILIRKWQFVSREAAEELFAGARDRVNRMGGVGAWRERNRKQSQGWDEEEPLDQADLTDEQKDMIEGQKEEMAAERDKYGTGKVEEEVEEKDDEVGFGSPFRIVRSRLIAIANAVFHPGHDAQEFECGVEPRRI